MVLAITQQQIADISAHAERVYPEECCGLMLGSIENAHKSLVEIVSLENHWIADDPDSAERYTKHRRFEIDPRDMLSVQKQARAQGLSIIGIYHSHPDHVAVPSECDRVQAWPEYAYVIVSVQGKQKQGNPSESGTAKAVDIQNWALDSNHQFQPEPMKVSPSSARGLARGSARGLARGSAKDRMPVSA